MRKDNISVLLHIPPYQIFMDNLPKQAGVRYVGVGISIS